MTQFSPLAWSLPSQANFDPADAQGRQALAEAANMQFVINGRIGQDYLGWLRENELPGLGLDSEHIDAYLHALTGADVKAFRQHFQNLVRGSKR